jgi:hypothetical protein
MEPLLTLDSLILSGTGLLLMYTIWTAHRFILKNDKHQERIYSELSEIKSKITNFETRERVDNLETRISRMEVRIENLEKTKEVKMLHG